MAVISDAAQPTTAIRGASQARRSDLARVRWMTTIVPALAVFLYETFRHTFMDHWLSIPEEYGNLVTGLLALGVCYAFSNAVFARIEHIQQGALEETGRAAALASMIEERERLSRELHDGLAQAVSLVMVRLDTVRNLVEGDRRTEAVRELEHLRSAVDEVNVEVRDSIAGLRARVVERGFVAALEDYLDAFEERYGIEADIQALSVQAIPPYVAVQLFRIVQEALTNVRKHAAATQVHVYLETRYPNLVEVNVVDDGAGFEPGEPASRVHSYGLAGMRERAEALGGTFQVDSRAGQGTSILVKLPVAGRT